MPALPWQWPPKQNSFAKSGRPRLIKVQGRDLFQIVPYCASDGRSVGRVVAIDVADGGSEPLIKWLRGLR
jgi:hypothetical protein